MEFEAINAPRQQNVSLWNRLRNHRVVDERGCHTWTGALDSKGRPAIKVKGTTMQAHRVAYEWKISKRPEGTEFHHTCVNPRCVKPEHLVPLTRAQHVAEHVRLRRLARDTSQADVSLTEPSTGLSSETVITRSNDKS